MIRTKEDLKYYLTEDSKHIRGAKLVVKWLTRSDDYLTIVLLRCLRHYEYYLNREKRLYHYPMFFWYWWNFRRLRVKANIMIFPNTLDAGVNIMHPGFRRIGTFSHIGTNCTILPNVLIGRKNPGTEAEVFIGNNCYISTGVTILGPVRIGDNVTIGAGAVVTKDIPGHTIVGGVPAQVIKYK